MFNPGIMERTIHKLDRMTLKYRAPKRRRTLEHTDFTIIFNNCWGGVLYETYGLQKISPTVGGYFYAKDYLRFVKQLDDYLNIPIKIIRADASRNREWIYKDGNSDCPIGLLGDVEFVFVHYKDPKVAEAKWMRRTERVNRGNLIFKFSQQNYATREDLETFDEMKLPGEKLMFVNKKDTPYNCAVYYPGFEDDDSVYNDTFYPEKYFDASVFLNEGRIIRRS